MKTLRRDGRKLNHEISEFVRLEAVKRVVKGKESPEAVIASYGLHRSNIYKWIGKYRRGGWKALKSEKSSGPKPKITKEEKKKLSACLIKNPQQLHFDFGLWTLCMVQELIRRKFGKKVSIWTVSRILRGIGFTKQKPLYRAWQQDPERVERWLRGEYPKIRREAKREKREIWFGDESGFRSTDHRGTTWGKRGETPIVRTTGARFGASSISAVTKKGSLRFMIYQGSFVAATCVGFLRRLMENQRRPVTLIWDGHPVHKTKAVAGFVESTGGKLKIYVLPPYSPEMNPDEQVWNNVKGSITRKMIGGPSQFIASIRSRLHSLQKQTDLIRSFFSHPDVAYVM